MLSLVDRLVEVSINIGRQRTVLKAVGHEIVLWKRVHLHFIRLGLQEVVKGSVLSSCLALVPVVNLFEAHARRHFFLLNALSQPLHECVARMRLHVH